MLNVDQYLRIFYQSTCCSNACLAVCTTSYIQIIVLVVADGVDICFFFFSAKISAPVSVTVFVQTDNKKITFSGNVCLVCSFFCHTRSRCWKTYGNVVVFIKNYICKVTCWALIVIIIICFYLSEIRTPQFIKIQIVTKHERLCIGCFSGFESASCGNTLIKRRLSQKINLIVRANVHFFNICRAVIIFYKLTLVIEYIYFWMSSETIYITIAINDRGNMLLMSISKPK